METPSPLEAPRKLRAFLEFDRFGRLDFDRGFDGGGLVQGADGFGFADFDAGGGVGLRDAVVVDGCLTAFGDVADGDLVVDRLDGVVRVVADDGGRFHG